MLLTDQREIAIVGAGGLGTPAALGLIESWPGSKLHLKIIDFDRIEPSNLNRQVLFTEEDLGRNKASVLAAALHARVTQERQGVHLTAVEERLSGDNVARLLGDADFVIDATDSVQTKLLINDFCVPNGKPFIYGGVLGERGQLLTVEPGVSGCLRCLYGEFGDTSSEELTCRTAGVLGAVVGAIGFLQAAEALRTLFPTVSSTNKHIRYSGSDRGSEFKTSWVAPALDCPLGCGGVQNRVLDLREKRCPETFLFTKVALEYLPAGGRLEVMLGNEESAATVWRSLTEQGFFATQRPRPVFEGGWHLIARNLRRENPYG